MTLTTAQWKVIRGYVLGGCDNPVVYKCAGKTINQLKKLGLLDCNGPTLAAIKYVESIELP